MTYLGMSLCIIDWKWNEFHALRHLETGNLLMKWLILKVCLLETDISKSTFANFFPLKNSISNFCKRKSLALINLMNDVNDEVFGLV